MEYNREEFRSDYQASSTALRQFQLPTWEDFPDIELYMDQMIVLLNRYLGNLGTEGKQVTASMINNYVKMRIMPAPVKKRYGRSHLAYLVVICLLKDALGTAVIQKVFPPGMEGELLQARYDRFVTNQRKACQYVAETIDNVAIPLLQEQEAERIQDLVMQVGITASLTKHLTEHFVLQPEETKSTP